MLATPKPLNGNCCTLLAPLAELLEKYHPLAATRCLRAMVDFSLKVGRSTRYSHAARHLHTCHVLSRRIESWGDLSEHRTYAAQLRQDHGRKYGFWSLMPNEAVLESEPASSDGSAQPGLW